jgi:DNA repair protein RadC
MNLFSFNEVKATYNRKWIGPSITSSRDVYDLLVTNWPNIDFEERFYVVMLSRGNNVLGVYELSVGSSSGTVADPKKIFSVALAANASAIILAHNHPSGQIKPSANDNLVTRKCQESGNFLKCPYWII